jgi:hypothetical protein
MKIFPINLNYHLIKRLKRIIKIESVFRAIFAFTKGVYYFVANLARLPDSFYEKIAISDCFYQL